MKPGTAYTVPITATGRAPYKNTGAPWALVQFGDVTSLVLTFEGASNRNGTIVYTQLPAISTAGVLYPAGATITPADNSAFYVPLGALAELVLNVSSIGAASTNPCTIGFEESGPPFTVPIGSGAGGSQPSVDSYTALAINLNAGANQNLVSAPGANKQIWVYGLVFGVNVAGTVSFQDEDDAALTGIMQFGVTGGMTCPPSGNFAQPLFKVATNKALEVDVVTSELDGVLTYGVVSV